MGGQPGELPTLLIGTMFYQGDKIVTDEKKGEFNKQKAEELIQKQEELSEKTGNPALIDIVGLNSEAIFKYIDFVSDFTSTPISIYNYQSNVMIPSIRYSAEIGLSDRIIYNHIAYFTKEEVIKNIKEAKIKSAVIYAFNLSNQRPAGRVEILYGTSQQESLLSIAQRSGIENFLVAEAACDIPGVDLTAKASHLIKEEFGLPAGGHLTDNLLNGLN